MENLNMTHQFNSGILQVYSGFNNNSFTNRGSDVGMDLIRELVKLMKGEVKIKNELSTEMIFEITIPSNKNTTKSDTKLLSFYKGDSFAQKVRNIILENIDDENFGIMELCRVIGISRSQLHNKIKANTSLSISIFIRFIRLEKAKFLLEQSDLNISEIAYEVGFKDPSYFSRLFCERYGIAPSKIRQKKNIMK